MRSCQRERQILVDARLEQGALQWYYHYTNNRLYFSFTKHIAYFNFTYYYL